MSDQIEEFDRVFREKLGGQTAPPPESVWENIEKKRTYGHVVANRVSNYWQTFGTLMLLLLGGGASLFLGENQTQPAKQQTQTVQFNQFDNSNVNSFQTSSSSNDLNQSYFSTLVEKNKVETESKPVSKEKASRFRLPDAELMASIQQAAFSKPENIEDQRLNAYINVLDGWETAKPISFIRYDYMNHASLQPFIVYNKQGEAKSADQVEYDYVREIFKKKTFKERAYWYFAFTPQNVQKILTPEFNLSSDYLRDRAKAENTRLAYTISAAIQYELNEHKFFESGINFTQIYEEMHYEGEKRFSNQYDFVEIPLLLGYKDRNAKWGWHLKGGLGIQVFNNFDGYILKKVADPNDPSIPQNQPDPDPNYRMKKSDAFINIITSNHKLSKNQDRRGILDLSNEDENPYKSAGVVNVHMAAGLSYHHSIKTSFMLTPHYSRSVNSISKESALFKEQISYFGVSFGTLIKF